MRFPPFLVPGDRIAVVAPAYTANEADVLAGCTVLESWGLNVVVGASVFSTFGSFAGSDDGRLSDLQQALDNPEVKAIICTRGGYGINRFLDRIVWDSFIQNPKWICGFSDVTALHLQIQKLGIASIHGPMAVHLSKPDQQISVKDLKNLLFGVTKKIVRPVTYQGYPNKPEQISGELTGGNLTLIVNSLGTKTEIDTRDKILFLEEIGEKVYRIDRMMNQLKRAGKLESLKGIVLGQFSSCEQGDFPFSVADTVFDISLGKIQIFSGLESGHSAPNLPLLLGCDATLYRENESGHFSQKIDHKPNSFFNS